ncbi:hypothetical protein KP509_27G053800 [Ceratopteris richardii]|uniref:GPI-anchored protein LLG1-like domain-containing protein n=1 Tax=Ceratopteris richardii TaxID=49495 RepID=A0A8T2RIY2_CERRI|nr:hypothetical protein KP509_27G053800 [Ceratopteris richardii]
MGVRFLAVCIVVYMSIFHAFGHTNYISLPSFDVHEEMHPNRHLLQTLQECTVNFQVQNYSIITSECKGPYYPVNACCEAFVKFACPFAAEINDNTTNCAATMFSYIKIYGNYPDGLFANECVGDAQGLPCTNVTTAPPASHAGLPAVKDQILRWLVAVLSIFVLLFLWGGGSQF